MTAERRRAVVVTPTYDEKENIADLIAAVLSEQEQVPAFELHVLVADSHSQDGTLDIVAALATVDPRVHLLDVQDAGIGIGLFKGFQHAIDALGADVLVEMDADFQHNPGDIPTFLAKIEEGYDVVVGSRFVEGSVNRMPLSRRVLSVGANQFVRAMLGLHERDRDHHFLPGVYPGDLPEGRSRIRAVARKVLHLRTGFPRTHAGHRRARDRDPHDDASPGAGLLEDDLLALHARYHRLLAEV